MQFYKTSSTLSFLYDFNILEFLWPILHIACQIRCFILYFICDWTVFIDLGIKHLLSGRHIEICCMSMIFIITVSLQQISEVCLKFVSIIKLLFWFFSVGTYSDEQLHLQPGSFNCGNLVPIICQTFVYFFHSPNKPSHIFSH